MTFITVPIVACDKLVHKNSTRDQSSTRDTELRDKTRRHQLFETEGRQKQDMSFCIVVVVSAISSKAVKNLY